MANLITRDRALCNLNNRDLSDDEEITLDALIAAVSRTIEQYCWRTFTVTSYDELYPGYGQRELMLRNYPVVSIERVAERPIAVLRITNTSASSQRASVKVTATGLELIRVASGASTTSTIDFEDQVTLSELAAAVNALGNSWSASVLDSADELRASADLRAIQGAFPAKDLNADLRMHTTEVANFSVDHERGCLHADDGAAWFGGHNYWRVLYRAGYGTIPDDVQEACAEWTAQLFWQTKRDPGLASESLPATMTREVLRDMPASTKFLLAPYRNWRV